MRGWSGEDGVRLYITLPQALARLRKPVVVDPPPPLPKFKIVPKILTHLSMRISGRCPNACRRAVTNASRVKTEVRTFVTKMYRSIVAKRHLAWHTTALVKRGECIAMLQYFIGS